MVSFVENESLVGAGHGSILQNQYIYIIIGSLCIMKISIIEKIVSFVENESLVGAGHGSILYDLIVLI